MKLGSSYTTALPTHRQQRLHLREEPRLLPPLPARRSGMDDIAVLSA